jgi:hypothetical protein
MRLIQEFGGATDSIWRVEEIEHRYLVLGFFFAVVATALALTLFFALQLWERLKRS